jgi:hypothetical protein
MSDSSQELPDEVPRRRERFFAVAPIGSVWAKPGHLVFKSYSAATKDADARNRERVLGQLRKKAVAASASTVFVVYLRRKKDADFASGTWRLARRTELQVMDADDVIAFAVEDAMIGG